MTDSLWKCIFICWMTCTIGAVFADDPPVAANSQVSEGVDARETAIRESVTRFVGAFNAHDAQAIGDLFLLDAQIVDENDNTIEGREEIVALFQGVFENSPETTIEVQIESIRFIGKALAVETGTTKTVAVPDATPELSRYSVVHVLQEEKWSMGLVRDMPTEPTPGEKLNSLAWLVGDWVDESPEGTVKTSCSWDESGNFLLQEITVLLSTGDTLKISQRIGWDPLTKKFKTWMFDSEGGHGESSWTPTEAGWLIKATSVRSDGTTTSATNYVEPTSLERYVFRSVDRVVGNEVVPDNEVIIVKQPPQPE